MRSVARFRAVLINQAYDGATTDLGQQRIFARRSIDGGATWSSRVALSVAGENATSPAVESRGTGDVRAWYMQTSNGGDPDAWNVFYRSSSDGGASWSTPVVISDVTSGAAYKHADGFDEVYGDYGEIAITSTGKTIATWGEGLSWVGPGGVWSTARTERSEPAARHSPSHTVDRPQRLVYASTTEWPDGSNVESLMEISLQWLDGRTLLTLTQRGVPSGDLERGFTEGTSGGRLGREPIFRYAPSALNPS
jgi:hypothetical protein